MALARPCRNVLMAAAVLGFPAGCGCTDVSNQGGGGAVAGAADTASTPDRIGRVAAIAPPARHADGRMPTALATAGDSGVYRLLVDAVESIGAPVLVRKPSDGILALMSDDERKTVLARVKAVSAAVGGRWTSGTGDASWLRLIARFEAAGRPSDRPAGAPEPHLFADAFPPVPVKSTDLAAEALPATPFGADFWNTSEFALGSTSVAVFLLESTGAIDPGTENWTSGQEDQVEAEIQAGLALMASLSPSAGLSFTIHFYKGRTDAAAQTPYEPINRSLTDMNDLVIPVVMAGLGYGSGEWYEREKRFIHDMRETDGTSWGFIIYVANSQNDGDGMFPDGYFAYAYYGGPHQVQTYDNDNWGISDMSKVTLHETGHTFYALDEYSAAGHGCNEATGYLNVKNRNSSVDDGTCQLPLVNCQMNEAAMQNDNYCTFTRGQVGWYDNDGDGIPDVRDTTPDLSLLPSARTSTQNLTVAVTGNAVEVPRENQNPQWYWGPSLRDISINVIDDVSYRVTQGTPGAWTAATAADGLFDEGSEDYSVSIAVSDGADYTIEVRARNSVANTFTSAVSNRVPVLDPIPTPQDVMISTPVTIVAGATDPDGETLYFTLSGKPATASWNPATRTFSWTPGAGEAGQYDLTFGVHDGVLSDSQGVRINVIGCDEGQPCLDDGNPCTNDTCTGGVCTHPPKLEGTGCDDDEPCTKNDACDAGGNCEGEAFTCPAPNECQVSVTCDGVGGCTVVDKSDSSPCTDDANECTSDVCQGGSCVHPPKTDGDPCTADADDCTYDRCQSGTCTHPAKADGESCTADANQCTDDVCQSGACAHPFIGQGTLCNDGVACTSADQCDGAGGCAGTAYQCVTNQCQASISCDGAGGCTAVNRPDETPCTADANQCTKDECHNGECTHPFRVQGYSCNDGQVCTHHDACDGAGNCGGTAYSCQPNECQYTSACDGSGGCVTTSKPENTQCSSDANDCTDDVCRSGQCVHNNVPNNTPCNDDNLCTTVDKCQLGVCAGTNPIQCFALDSCHLAGACDPQTGQCSNPIKSEGSDCDDGVACTMDDECDDQGRCTGTAYVCAPPNECQVSSQCDGLGGCIVVNKTNGVACASDGNSCTDDVCQSGQCVHTPRASGSNCNDGDGCTKQDKCNALGQCVGTAYTCPVATECHQSVTCDGIGGCIVVNKPDLAACSSDGRQCTDDVCLGGVCQHPDSPFATPCDDGNKCTLDDGCQAGWCVGRAVTCAALDSCHDAGTCDQQTGLCSNPSRTDGTACSDGNLCTAGDTCLAGVCGGSAVACAAPDQCHDPGVCDTQTGSCTNPPKGDGTACNDGNACTLTDVCAGGACTGTNPVSCPPTDQCHKAGICDPQTGGCSNPVKPDTALCDDGNPCTRIDRCFAGICAGEEYSCRPPDVCESAIVCDGAGGCTVVDEAEGTACSRGDPCSRDDHCDGQGNCISGGVNPACEDGGTGTPDGGTGLEDGGAGTGDGAASAEDAGVEVQDGETPGDDSGTAGGDGGEPDGGPVTTDTGGELDSSGAADTWDPTDTSGQPDVGVSDAGQDAGDGRTQAGDGGPSLQDGGAVDGGAIVPAADSASEGGESGSGCSCASVGT